MIETSGVSYVSVSVIETSGVSYVSVSVIETSGHPMSVSEAKHRTCSIRE